jgi:hypothetical protein
MRSERELVLEISRIGLESDSVEEAVELAQSLLAGEIGGSAILLDPVEQGISPWATKCVSEYLDSRQFPFRGVTVPLVVNNIKVGRLIACFVSFGFPGELLQNLAAHIAKQLGALLARTHRKVLPRLEAA